jgi:hypothetical protein
LDNYVFTVPSNQASTRFFFYMDLPTSTDSNKDTLLQALDIDEDGGPTDED